MSVCDRLRRPVKCAQFDSSSLSGEQQLFTRLYFCCSVPLFLSAGRKSEEGEERKTKKYTRHVAEMLLLANKMPIMPAVLICSAPSLTLHDYSVKAPLSSRAESHLVPWH